MVVYLKKASWGVAILAVAISGGLAGSAKGLWKESIAKEEPAKEEPAKEEPAPAMKFHDSNDPLPVDKVVEEQRQLAEQKQAAEQSQTAAPVPQANPQQKAQAPLASRSGAPKAAAPVANNPSNGAGKVLQMKATAYGPANSNKEFGGKTYLGTKVRPGVIAVDPKVIPLGTRVWVSGYKHPNLPANGFMAVAEDIGGAIRGNRIDIFIDAPDQSVSDFGIQNVQVRIIGK
jgi:3D (Asp-Asp-Asp) domain-containing protein